MTTKEITLTKLEAEKGKMLTNGESWGTVVYLGVGDSQENWREAAVEEYEAAMAAAAETAETELAAP